MSENAKKISKRLLWVYYRFDISAACNKVEYLCYVKGKIIFSMRCRINLMNYFLKSQSFSLFLYQSLAVKLLK